MTSRKSIDILYLLSIIERMTLCSCAAKPRLVYWSDTKRSDFISLVGELNYRSYPVRYFELEEPLIPLAYKRQYFEYDDAKSYFTYTDAMRKLPDPAIEALFSCVFFDYPIMLFLQDKGCIGVTHYLRSPGMSFPNFVRFPPAHLIGSVLSRLVVLLSCYVDSVKPIVHVGHDRLYMRHENLVAVFTDRTDILSDLQRFVREYTLNTARLRPITDPCRVQPRSHGILGDLINAAKVSVFQGGRL